MESAWVVLRVGPEFEWEWDGNRLVFQVGKPVEVPLLFAQSVLGYGSDDKYPFVVRLGWTKTTNDLDEAIERLSHVEISGEKPSALCAPSPAQGLPPAPVIIRRERGKGTGIAA
jgi:hypothetical protein